MSHPAMKRHGENLSACYYEKETNMKNLYSVPFQLYDILKKANSGAKKISGCQGELEERVSRQNTQHFQGTENTLCFAQC